MTPRISLSMHFSAHCTHGPIIQSRMSYIVRRPLPPVDRTWALSSYSDLQSVLWTLIWNLKYQITTSIGGAENQWLYSEILRYWRNTVFAVVIIIVGNPDAKASSDWLLFFCFCAYILSADTGPFSLGPLSIIADIPQRVYLCRGKKTIRLCSQSIVLASSLSPYSLPLLERTIK